MAFHNINHVIIPNGTTFAEFQQLYSKEDIDAISIAIQSKGIFKADDINADYTCEVILSNTKYSLPIELAKDYLIPIALRILRPGSTNPSDPYANFPGQPSQTGATIPVPQQASFIPSAPQATAAPSQRSAAPSIAPQPSVSLQSPQTAQDPQSVRIPQLSTEEVQSNLLKAWMPKFKNLAFVPNALETLFLMYRTPSNDVQVILNSLIQNKMTLQNQLDVMYDAFNICSRSDFFPKGNDLINILINSGLDLESAQVLVEQFSIKTAWKSIFTSLLFFDKEYNELFASLFAKGLNKSNQLQILWDFFKSINRKDILQKILHLSLILKQTGLSDDEADRMIREYRLTANPLPKWTLGWSRYIPNFEYAAIQLLDQGMTSENQVIRIYNYLGREFPWNQFKNILASSGVNSSQIQEMEVELRLKITWDELFKNIPGKPASEDIILELIAQGKSKNDPLTLNNQHIKIWNYLAAKHYEKSFPADIHLGTYIHSTGLDQNTAEGMVREFRTKLNEALAKQNQTTQATQTPAPRSVGDTRLERIGWITAWLPILQEVERENNKAYKNLMSLYKMKSDYSVVGFLSDIWMYSALQHLHTKDKTLDFFWSLFQQIRAENFFPRDDETLKSILEKSSYDKSSIDDIVAIFKNQRGWK